MSRRGFTIAVVSLPTLQKIIRDGDRELRRQRPGLDYRQGYVEGRKDAAREILAQSRKS